MTSNDHKPYLSKPLFIRGLQCHKSLYLDRKHPELRDEISEVQGALFQGGDGGRAVCQKAFPWRENLNLENFKIKREETLMLKYDVEKKALIQLESTEMKE